MVKVMNFYISTFQSMWAVPTLTFVCNALLSCSHYYYYYYYYYFIGLAWITDEQWGNNTGRENEILGEKPCLSAKSHMDWPKIEPGTPKLPRKSYFPKKSQSSHLERRALHWFNVIYKFTRSLFFRRKTGN